MQHVFLFLRNQEAILQVILFGMKRHLTLCFRLVGLKILLFLFSKVVEGFNKFLSQKALVLIKAVALGPKCSALDILYFELDDFAGDGGDVDIKVSPHLKIIIFITAIQPSILCNNQYYSNIFYQYSMKKNSSQISLNKSSWANKYGVSKQNNGAPVFGLNPNLNIEDEYIENLLKQIHFMNMEVKLLKEKQQQSEGNSLWGIINRSDQPLVHNIVDSNQKYQAMKKQVDTDLNKTQYENIKLGDQQNALIHKLNHLENKITSLQTKRSEVEAASKAKQDKITEKIEEHSVKIKNISIQKEDQNKKNIDLNAQYQSLVLQVQKQKFTTNNDMLRIKNDEDIEQIIETHRTEEIKSLKSKIQNLKESIENSCEFQRAKEDQTTIRQNMNKILTSIATSDFELIQLQASIKLAVDQKEKEVLERKRFMEQFESLKKVLKELQSLNSVRLSQQVALRKRESLDIQKGELQSKKLQKNLEQIKKKLSRSQDSERILKQQVQHMEKQLVKLKEKRTELSQTLNKLATANDKQDTTLTNHRNQYRRMQDQFQKIVNAELASAIDLNEIETQIIYLRERKEYLSEVLNLKDALNQTKLQELQKVVQKNRDVNETVGLLMERWEQIRSFSKN